MSNLYQKGIMVFPAGEEVDVPFFLEQTKNNGTLVLTIEGVRSKVEHTLAFRESKEGEALLYAKVKRIKKAGQSDPGKEEILKGAKMIARISWVTTSAHLGQTTMETLSKEKTFEPVPDHQCLVDLLVRHGWTIQRSKEMKGSSRRYVRKPGLVSGSTAVINEGVFSNHVTTTTMGKGRFSYLDLWNHFYK